MQRIRKSWLGAASVVLSTGLVLAGCSSADETTTDETTSASETAVETTETAVAANLKVGIVLPLTGDLSAYGASLAAGAEMGVQLVNEAAVAAGFSEPCMIVGTEDTQTNPTAGVEAATKLITVDGAELLIGPMSSGVLLAMAESVIIPNNTVLVSPTASDPAVTDLVDNDLIFRVYPSDALQSTALVQVMSQAFGSDATINVGARNDAFGTSLLKKFTTEWSAQGGSIGEEVQWNPDAPNFDTEAAKLASGNPDGWLIIDFPTTFAKLGPALVRSGKWDASRTFMTEALKSQGAIDEVGVEIMEGIRGTAATSDGADPEAFVDEFSKRFPDIAVTGFEGTSFDSAVLSCLAALHAGSTDPVALAASLRAMSGPDGTVHNWQDLSGAVADAAAGSPIAYQGAWAEVNFDANGDPGAGVYDVWQVTGGAAESIDRIAFKG